MRRLEDYGVTQRRFLWLAVSQGVALDDPTATDARIARLKLDGLIHQRTSKGGRVSWRATDAGVTLVRTEKNLPSLPPNERDGVKRDVARRRKGSSKTRSRSAGAELITDDAAETIRYWREHHAATLFVYFIQEADDGPVKIGEAENPIRRLEAMQCGNPRHLRIAAVILAGRTTEWQLHSYWRSSAWVRGEWFAKGQQEAILAKARQIAAAQIDAHKEREPMDDIRGKVFVRELFAEQVAPAAVV